MIKIIEVQDMDESYQILLTCEGKSYRAYTDFKKMLFVACEVKQYKPDAERVEKEISEKIKRYIISEMKEILAGSYGMKRDLFEKWSNRKEYYYVKKEKTNA